MTTVIVAIALALLALVALAVIWDRPDDEDPPPPDDPTTVRIVPNIDIPLGPAC